MNIDRIFALNVLESYLEDLEAEGIQKLKKESADSIGFYMSDPDDIEWDMEDLQKAARSALDSSVEYQKALNMHQHLLDGGVLSFVETEAEECLISESATRKKVNLSTTTYFQ